MPSERSRYLYETPSTTAGLLRADALAALESKGAGALAEMIWQKSERDRGLRHQLAVMVLRSKMAPAPSAEAVRSLLEQLVSLCKFEANWRDNDDGWALFLAEVVSLVETLLKKVPLDLVQSQIQEIIQAAEESSFQMDDCYSCGLEIEELERLLAGNTCSK